MAARRIPWTTTAHWLALALLAGGAHAQADFVGGWVGGIELGEQFVPFALRIDEGPAAGSLVTRVQRLDEMRPPVATSSTEIDQEQLHVGFDRGGIVWSLRLRSQVDGLGGEFVSAAGSFAARFTRMALLAPDELERLAGVFELEDGSRLRLDALPAGFLRACFLDGGRFQYLFPSDATALFGGPGFERALPKTLAVTFLDECARLEWRDPDAEPWQARRIVPERLRLSLEGLTITGPDLALPLVRIEPGAFEMGQHRPSAEIMPLFGLTPPAAPEVDPLRATTITRPFLLASVELTNAWFAAFVRETGTMTDAERLGSGLVWNGTRMVEDPGASWRDPRVATSGDSPVVMVSWNDAVAFCTWLGGELGRVVRLPTEAEWEYACRAGTDTMFAWGDDLGVVDAYAWGHPRALGPRPVGTLRPNAWGLHDMHGNAWEWCSDVFAPIAAEPAADPRGPERGPTRVLRGGSWINGPWQQRSAFRAGEPAELAEPHIGFRIAVEVDG